MNDYLDHKPRSYYLIFNNKKALLIYFAVPELSPYELLMSAQFQGFDKTAKFMQLDSTEYNSLREEDSNLDTGGALFKYVEAHKTESKFIFEVWNPIDSCVMCINKIIGNKVVGSNDKELWVS